MNETTELIMTAMAWGSTVLAALCATVQVGVGNLLATAVCVLSDTSKMTEAEA